MAGTTVRSETSYVTRTCLTWTPDGELSAEDRALMLELLQQQEPEAVWPYSVPTDQVPPRAQEAR